MSISLCMIVKNEEAMLERCLSSVKHIADEMIIVDTGSTDKTCEIARKFGAQIYEYPWDGSFANARNFSLSHAKMDWILLMDADDEFEYEDTQQMMELMSPEKKETLYFFRTLSFMGDNADVSKAVSNMNVRLLKNHLGYHFVGNIHEQIVGDRETMGISQLKNIRVYHYGYLNAAIKEKNKRQRNIELIQKELDKTPDDSFMLFNMGTEYYAMSDFSKALEYYLKSYEDFAPQKGFSPKLLVRIISCLDLVGRSDEMLKYIDEGLKIYPDYTELEFLRGNKLLKEEKYLPAIASLKKCLAMGDAPTPISYILGIGSYKSQLLLSTIYQSLGDEKQALRYCRTALKNNPEYKEAYRQMYCLMSRHAPAKSLRKKLERFLPNNDAAHYLMLSDVYYALQLFSEAYFYARKAEKLISDSAEALYDEGICLFYMGKYKQALRCLEKVSSEKASYYMALCLRFDTDLHAQVKSYANEYFVIMDCFDKLLDGKSCDTLAEDIESSAPYIAPIFKLLDILLVLRRFEWFDKARKLLNLISDDSVLMQLGKLYFKRGFIKPAYDELVRSIKLTGKIDAEGLDIMKIALEDKKEQQVSAQPERPFAETPQTEASKNQP